MKSCYFRLNITQWHLIISIWVPILSLDIIYPKLFDQHFFTSPKICFNEREWWSHSKKHSSTMWKKKKKKLFDIFNCEQVRGKKKKYGHYRNALFWHLCIFQNTPSKRDEASVGQEDKQQKNEKCGKKSSNIKLPMRERERIRIYWIL